MIAGVLVVDAALESNDSKKRFKTHARISGLTPDIFISVLWIPKPRQHLTNLHIGWGRGVGPNEVMFHVNTGAFPIPRVTDSIFLYPMSIYASLQQRRRSQYVKNMNQL